MRARWDSLRTSRAAGVIAWAAVAPLAAWATVRLLGAERGFPLVPILAFTPYAAAASLAALGLAIGLGRRAAAVAAAAVALAFAAAVGPRAVGGGGADVAGGASLRVLTVNLEFGQADPERVAALVAEHDADVLSLQELTRRYVPRLRAALDGRLPHELVLARPQAAGGGLLSRWPLEPVSGSREVPSGFALPRAVAAVPRAGPVELVSVHTSPPTDWGVAEWAEDLRALPRAGGDPPKVLAGDFNATLDHHPLRELIDSGYTDAADATGRGLVPTWADERRLPPLVTIDHVLADERMGIGSYAVDDVPGSDHRAVFAELELPPG